MEIILGNITRSNILFHTSEHLIVNFIIMLHVLAFPTECLFSLKVQRYELKRSYSIKITSKSLCIN